MKKNTSLSQFSQEIVSTILAYADQQSMDFIIASLSKISFENWLIKLIRSAFFYKKYINSIDRSIYCILPSDCSNEINKKYYQTYTDQYIYSQILQTTHKFSELEQALTQYFSKDFSQQIQKIYLKPSLAISKLIDEKSQALCRTTYQFMLLEKYEQYYSPSLFQYFSSRSQTNIKHSSISKLVNRILNKDQKCPIDLQKPTTKQLLRLVYLKPEDISIENYQSMIIQEFQIHNLFVLLFAYAEQLVSCWQFYLTQIQDPIELLCEFNLRYLCICNLSNSLQQLLGSVFRQYSEIVSQVLKCKNPTLKYSVYTPINKIWDKKMKKFYEKCCEIFQYLLLKERNKRIIFKFQQLMYNHSLSLQCKKQIYTLIETAKQNTFYSFLKNRKNQIFAQNVRISAEDYLESEPFHLQINISNFANSMINLYMDEKTVSWCNHSKFCPSSVYNKFSESILAQYVLTYLQLKQRMKVQQALIIIKQLILLDTNMFYQYFHPVTVCKFIDKILEIFEGYQFSQLQQIMHQIQRNDNYIERINKKRQVSPRYIQIRQQNSMIVQLPMQYANTDNLQEYNSDEEQQNIANILKH